MSASVSRDSESAARGQQVFTAVAFLYDINESGQPRVCMPRRALSKKFLPGVFELPGGHIDYGEHFVDGLKRELREELGIEVTVGDPFAVFDYKNEVKGSHSVEVVYFAQLADASGDIMLNAADHSEYKWFTREEADQMYVDEQLPEDPERDVVRKGFALLAQRSSAVNYAEDI